MFNCINVYPDDITHLKKGTISRPIHLTYDELELTEGVKEHFFAIGTERKVQHPLVQQLLQQKL